MKKTLEFEYWFGEIIYRKVDNAKGYIVGINLRPGEPTGQGGYAVSYVVSFGVETEMYWGFEIDSQKSFDTGDLE